MSKMTERKKERLLYRLHRISVAIDDLYLEIEDQDLPNGHKLRTLCVQMMNKLKDCYDSFALSCEERDNANPPFSLGGGST